MKTKFALWAYDLRKIPEKIWTFIAWHLPEELVYYAAIRLMARATTGPYSKQIVPELTAMDALKRWKIGY